jgi:hypothetical protein
LVVVVEAVAGGDDLAATYLQELEAHLCMDGILYRGARCARVFAGWPSQPKLRERPGSHQHAGLRGSLCSHAHDACLGRFLVVSMLSNHFVRRKIHGSVSLPFLSRAC